MLTNMLRVFACGSIACAVSNWWSIAVSFRISFLKLGKMIWLMLLNTLPGIVLFFERSVSRAWYGCKIDSPICRRTYSFQSLRLQAVECVFLCGVVGQPYSIKQCTPRFFSKRTGRWRGNSEQPVIVATTGDCKRDDDDELHCLTIQ